jgi:hypothetical protein
VRSTSKARTTVVKTTAVVLTLLVFATIGEVAGDPDLQREKRLVRTEWAVCTLLLADSARCGGLIRWLRRPRSG